MNAKEAIESLREFIDSLKNHNRDSDFGIKPSIAAERSLGKATPATLEGVLGVLERQSEVLRVLKEHTWLLDYMGSGIQNPPKPPAAYHVRVYVNADEPCFPIIKKWIKEEKK